MCTLDNGMEEFHAAHTGFYIREVQIFLSRRLTVLDLKNSADYAAVDIGDCDIIALRVTKRHTSQFTCGYINTIAGTVERAGSFTLFDIDYFIRTGLTPLQATLGTHDSKLDFIGAATGNLSEPVCTMCAVIIFQNNIIIQIKLFAEGISGSQQALNLQAGDIVDQMLHMLLAILGYYVIGPFMTAILTVLTAGVDFLVSHSLLPLVSIFIEPAKVLFLNNAINHGIFNPIGVSQAAEAGRSIMYMLETNPGPGLGVLLAYCLFCKDKTTRQSAPGAVVIHLLGGIHEIYFPYILMNPIIILAPIAGNFCAILFYTMTGTGLSGPASPGSIIAYMAMAPRDSVLTVFIGVVLAAAVSFVLSSVILKATSGNAQNLSEAQAKMQDMKAQAKGEAPAAIESAPINAGDVRKIVFSCDAGMGSSAMGATKFHNRIKAERPELIVTNSSVDNVPADADIVVCQRVLAERARRSAPQAQIITIGNFLADPNLDTLYQTLTAAPAAKAAAPETTDEPAAQDQGLVIQAEDIQLGLPSVDKETAIRAAGALLAKRGYVDADYADAMVEREKLVTTYMGMGVAIPHGTSEKKSTVKKSGAVMLQYPDGVDFGDEKAYLIFGIAGVGDAHLDLLAHVCEVLEDEEALEMMKKTPDIKFVLTHLQ